MEKENKSVFIADMHTHTLASTHAYSTITENALWASQHGIKYLGMTDHGIQMQDSPDTWHFENLRILPDYLYGVRIIRGIEANITDYEGNIDIYPEYVYDSLEWVNVSFHKQVLPAGTKADHTRAYLGALKNPRVDVICHSEDIHYDYDFDAVCRECADRGRLIELNVCRLLRGRNADHRYMLILEACEKYGTSIIVNSDAHFYTKIGDFAPAEELLKKTGFPLELVVNADEKRMEQYLESRKNRL